MARSILEFLLNINRRGTGATDAEKELSALQKTTGAVNNVLGAFGLALTTKAAFDFANATREANRAQKDALGSLQASAKGVADYEETLRLAKQETLGMASTTQLANATSTLFGAGLATTSKEAAQLATAGTILSGVFKDAGASQELFVRLLSSGSPVLFNNFGLTAQMVQAKQKEIEATTNLTGEEAKSQALKEVLIAQSQKYKSALSEETIQAGQAAASQQDFMAAFGELVNETDRATGATNLFIAAMQQMTEGAKSWGWVIDVTGDILDQNRALAEASGAQADYQAALGGTSAAAHDASSGVDMYQQGVMGATDATEEATAAMPPYVSSLRAMDVSSQSAAEAQRILADEIHNTTQAQQAAQFGPQTNREADAYRQLALAKAGQVESLADFQNQVDQERIDKQKQAEEEAQHQSEQTAQQFAKSFTQAADQIGNTISSKLSTTFQEVFKLPEGSADHADEPARRLATVAAAGFGSEWLTQLNAQFAGQDFWKPMTAAMQSGNGAELQAAATGILQQFSQGLITNLFDVNVIRGQVRAEITQKRLKEQLIEEVKAGLGTEGISQAIGVVEVAAGNVGVATAQTGTNVSTMATTATTAGGEMKTAFDAPLTSVNTLILRIAELNKMLERTKVLAGEAGSAIGGLNPPAPGANGSGVPNGAQMKIGGMSPQ